MRHLGSLVLCLVVGALVWLLVGVSGSKWVEAERATDSSRYAAFALALAAALVAGGLYGLLVLARLSPIGTVFTGLLLLGAGLWTLFSLSSFVRLVPRDIFGVRDAGYGMAGPFGLMVAMPLLLTLFSPRRWRRWSNAPAAVAPAPNYSPPPVVPANSYQPPPPTPSYGSPSYNSPSYSPSSAYNSPVSPAFGGSPEPASPSYAPPGLPSLPPPPPYAGGDDPEATRRL